MAATESVIASANSEPSDRLTTATQPHAVPSPTVDASPTVPSTSPAAASARYTRTPITRPQSRETSSTPGIAITLSSARSAPALPSDQPPSMSASASHALRPKKQSAWKPNTRVADQAKPLRHGRWSTVSTGRACPSESRESRTQAGTASAPARASNPSDQRQLSVASASGTASPAPSVAPTLSPSANTPVPSAGRSAKRSFTTTGSKAPTTPEPTPNTKVSATIAENPGESGRRTVAIAIVARHQPVAVRTSVRRSSRATGSANSPMHRTGTVTRRPAVAWSIPKSSWISGSNGPTAVSCGRIARVPASSPTRRTARGRFTTLLSASWRCPAQPCW